MKRLLYLNNASSTFFSHRIGWARAAHEAGWSVTVAGPFTGEEARRLRGEGWAVEPFALTRGVGRPTDELRTFARLRALYQRVEPDVVHIVSPKLIAYGGSVARAVRVPSVVYTMTGLGTGFLSTGLRGHVYRAVLGGLLRVAFGHPSHRLVFQNPDDAATVRRLTGYSGVHVLVRGSGVDLRRFRRAPEPAGPPIIGLPARMLRDKGVEEFVEAARILRRRHPEVRCALIGGTDEANPSAVASGTLRDWVRQGVVEWWGHQDDMPAALARCSIICLPSYREGLPKALLEASAVGRALVATDVPGCREVVIDGETGLLVPVRSVHALTVALERLITDAPLRAQFAEGARRHVEREFSLALVTEALLRVYGELATM